MTVKKSMLLLATMVLCVFTSDVVAQSNSDELPKFEVGAHFTSITKPAFSGGDTNPGFGGRFTYNLNRIFSLEAAGYFFPKECFSCAEPGRVTQAVGGVKVGKRFESWGIFAKVRPGIVSFSQGEFDVIPTGTVTPLTSFQIIRDPVTSFATDIGGVLEFYPSKRIVTRFDAGDTIIFFTRRTNNQFTFDPATNMVVVGPVVRPARTTHSFQFMASVGFRF